MAIAEAKLLLKLKRPLTMIYVCPMKPTVNIVSFKIRCFDGVPQNKKSAFPN